ncbi:hypothetical protein Vspart_01329 [Vibrio spartinae]|uniref:Uncharacterized protein n=1 Tax=Vibrio spartinae TaxID=1918945 RepID=A0ABX6QYJ3_9VIBR|nr:hypothetical protein Vspart_01329 [Vibrio spartinae]
MLHRSKELNIAKIVSDYGRPRRTGTFTNSIYTEKTDFAPSILKHESIVQVNMTPKFIPIF